MTFAYTEKQHGGISLITGWYRANTSAGATSTVFNRWGTGTALPIVMTHQGCVLGTSVVPSNRVGTTGGGTIRYEVFKNGTLLCQTQDFAAGTLFVDLYEAFTPGLYEFSAGDYLDVRYTTSAGWSSTATVQHVGLYIMTRSPVMV